MQQPELGKRIAELRKTKGFTQEELVEKCNVSVRTLQRIESGEVYPRSYTIKAIFTALDYVYDSVDFASIDFSKSENNISNRLEQFYRYVLDLFNLKTNTMKKIMTLSVPLMVVGVVFLFSLFSFKGQKKTDQSSALIGTWQILDLKTGLADTMFGGQENLTRYKYITPTKFMVADINYKEKVMFGAFSGSFSIEGDVYTEFIENTGTNYYPYLENRNTFRFKLVGDTLFFKGINNGYNEKWIRIK